MKKNKIIIAVFSMISLVFSSFASITIANGVDPVVDPPEVNEVLVIGESIDVDKTVNTPAIPPLIDVCLLEDETASFFDDIIHLQTAASDIYDNVVAASPDAQFAVAGFRDYPVDPYGLPGDHVYRLLQGMSSVKTDWLNGIAALGAGGGNDLPEAQYDAIVAAAGPGSFDDPTLGEQGNCGWRDDSVGAKRVLVVVTDAAFHLPDGTHINDHASTVAALNDQNITIIGLKAPDSGDELDDLADATDGSVQSLSSDGANIAAAILAGLGNLPITVIPVPVGCDPLVVTFAPASQTVTSGDPAYFVETIAVPNDPFLEGTTQSCIVEFQDDSGSVLGEQTISIEIPDTTPPVVSCVETVNPSGKNIPPAGNTTLPGNKGGMNEDGFYQLLAEDAVDPDAMICVEDEESGESLGCYASGTNVKYTEVASASRVKPWGSVKSFVEWHIFGNGDMIIYAKDSAGNVSAPTTCLVPPLPK